MAEQRLTSCIGRAVSPYVSSDAFGGACMTGIGGTPIAAAGGPGGTRRLVFDVYHEGDGLRGCVVDAERGLLKGLLLDMRVVAISDPVVPPLYVDSVHVDLGEPRDVLFVVPPKPP